MSLQLIIEDLEGSQTVVPLGEEALTIGRREGNTIQLTEQNVSRQHARIVPEQDAWFIEDLDSYNGVIVNGAPISGRVVLHEGDQVVIGDYHLILIDNTEKKTLDLSRPVRPANMQSPDHGRQDMVPTGEVAALPQEDADEGGRRAGGLIAVVLVIGLVGIGALVAVQQGWIGGAGGPGAGKAGGPAGGGAQASSHSGGSEATARTSGPSDATAAGDGAVQPDAASTGAAPATAGTLAADDDDATDETTTGQASAGGPTADSTSASADTVDPPPEDAHAEGTTAAGSGGAKKPAPVVDAKALLEEARAAALEDPAKAYQLAKKSYTAKHTAEALKIMGAAACNLGDATKAKAAQAKMSEKDAKQLGQLCDSKGVSLD